jgi:hypothetical protein
VNLQYALATFDIRTRHDNAPVETPWPQQRGVQDIWPVGRSDKNYPFIGLEAVHFHEQLVQCLLPLVVAAAKSGATVAPDGIDLVYKYDAGRILLALNE